MTKSPVSTISAWAQNRWATVRNSQLSDLFFLFARWFFTIALCGVGFYLAYVGFAAERLGIVPQLAAQAATITIFLLAVQIYPMLRLSDKSDVRDWTHGLLLFSIGFALFGTINMGLKATQQIQQWGDSDRSDIHEAHVLHNEGIAAKKQEGEKVNTLRLRKWIQAMSVLQAVTERNNGNLSARANLAIFKGRLAVEDEFPDDKEMEKKHDQDLLYQAIKEMESIREQDALTLDKYRWSEHTRTLGRLHSDLAKVSTDRENELRTAADLLKTARMKGSPATWDMLELESEILQLLGSHTEAVRLLLAADLVSQLNPPGSDVARREEIRKKLRTVAQQAGGKYQESINDLIESVLLASIQ